MGLVLLRPFALIFIFILISDVIKCEVRKLENSSWNLVNSEICGSARVGSRITKGKSTPLGKYPWMARLGYETVDKNIRFQCGGCLINNIYVLTAAHCILGLVPKLKVIRLGENVANTTEDCNAETCAPPVQDIGIGKLHMHERYNHTTVKNDIALIRLAQEAVYNEFVRPICLPRGDILSKNYIAQYVEIAGWGVVDSSTEQESNTLLYVSLPVRDRCACNTGLPELNIDDSQFCVGIETGEDSCGGDSGGPMMKMEYVAGRKKYHVLGVVSVGKSYCGESPAVYTNVIKYVDWILAVIVEDNEQYTAAAELVVAENYTNLEGLEDLEPYEYIA